MIALLIKERVLPLADSDRVEQTIRTSKQVWVLLDSEATARERVAII